MQLSGVAIINALFHFAVNPCIVELYLRLLDPKGRWVYEVLAYDGFHM